MFNNENPLSRLSLLVHPAHPTRPAAQLHGQSQRLASLYPELVVKADKGAELEERREKSVFHPSLTDTIVHQYRSCHTLYGPAEALTREELSWFGDAKDEARWYQERDATRDATRQQGITVMRQVAELCYDGKSGRYSELPGPGLSEFLLKPRFNSTMYAPMGAEQFLPDNRSAKQWHDLDFFRNWLQLYHYARGVDFDDAGERQRFLMLLTFLQFYQGVPEKQIHVLLTIATHADAFSAIDPPEPEGGECFTEPHHHGD